MATIGGMTVRGFSSPLMQALRNRQLDDRVLVVEATANLADAIPRGTT